MLHPAALRRRAWRKRIAFEIFERQHLRDAAVVHATVEEEAAILREFVPAARIVTIPNAVDVESPRIERRRGCARSASALPAEAPARRVPRTAASHQAARPARRRVRDAFATRHPAAPPRARRARRRRTAAHRGPGGAASGTRSRIVGALGDAEKWALLREATVLVLCSDSENFGVSVVEALASGCPVVATRTCPWQELEAEGAGRWVAQDARAIADAVSAIVGDPALKASMGEQGARLARDALRPPGGWRGDGGLLCRHSFREAAGRMIEGVREVLVITPAIDGADGISEVSRQFVAGLDTLDPAIRVEVWALDGAAPPDRSLGRATFRSAGGSRTRFSAWALARARTASDALLVVVLHVHLAPLALPLEMRGARLAFFFHGIEVWRRLRARERHALDRASVLMANSQWTVTHFKEANPEYASANIRVCHLGVSPAAAADPRAPRGLRPHRRTAGRVGALQGTRRADRRLARGARCRAGRRTADRRRRRRPGQARGARRVARTWRGGAFAGRVSNSVLEGLYRGAAFFAMPSVGEGFGLAYLEAMRAGKACLAGPGAAAEVVEDGVTGLIVDPGQPAQALAAALVQLFREPETRAADGEGRRGPRKGRVRDAAFCRPRPWRTLGGAGARMNVLGLNAYHGDVSAALVATASWWRPSKRSASAASSTSPGFPHTAIAECLGMGGHHGRGRRSLRGLAESQARTCGARRCFSLRHRPKNTVGDRAKNMSRLRALPETIAAVARARSSRASGSKLRFIEHHPAHLASAFFVCPFDEAAVCAIDGFGDFVSTSWGTRARARRSTSIGRVFFPHSLGLLYLAITQYLGFPNYGDEFKVMGLAPYGEPRFADRSRRLVAPAATTAGSSSTCRTSRHWSERRADDVGRRRAGDRPRVHAEARGAARARRAGRTSRCSRSTRPSRRRCRWCSRRRRSTCSAHVHAAHAARRGCAWPAAAR